MKRNTYLTLLERERVPVIMCAWRRIGRLSHTLQMLAVQDVPVTLYIWNNNRREETRINTILAESPIPVQSVHSKRNIGSFGRFYLARDLADVHDAVVFIDDDQDFGSSMIADQLTSFASETLAGWWAFTYRSGARSYADRDRVETPLHPADHVGPGGMIADASIFGDPALFSCPRRYWFVDDIWLSYYAGHVRGWRLRRSLARFEFVRDEHDLDLTLGTKKIRMFRHLKRRGWNVGSADD